MASLKKKRPSRVFPMLLYIAAGGMAAGIGYGSVWTAAQFIPKPKPVTAELQAPATASPMVSLAEPPSPFVTAGDPISPLRLPKLRPVILLEGEGVSHPYEEIPHEPVYEPEHPPRQMPEHMNDVEAPSTDMDVAGEENLPWRRNAVAVPDTGDRPLIAIVIDDAGLDKDRTLQIINLPGPMTISFLPYASRLRDQVSLARENGHEIMLHVSMEPENAALDPGPHVLRVGDSEAVMLENLSWALGRFSGYVGINNHMGSKFTTDAGGMRIVMQELQRRGLLFVDSRTNRETVAGAMARSIGVPVAERNVFLDHKATAEAVTDQLRQLEEIARKRGHAVGIGHPRDATIEVLSAWLPTAAEKGFALVPISAVVLEEQNLELSARKAGESR